MRERLAALMICVLAAPAGADTHPTWYADLGVATGIAENVDLNDTGARAEFDRGPVASIALGRHIGARWRVEAGLIHQENELETLHWPDASEDLWINHNDYVRMTSVMLSVIRGFRVGALEPYLGVGLGAGQVSYHFREKPYASDSIPILDDDATAFAYQLIAGFDVHLAPDWSLGFDYRLRQAPDVSVTDESGDDLDLEHTTYSAGMHLRHLFAGAWQPERDLPRTPGTGWTLGASLGTAYAKDSEVSDSVENLDAFKTGPLVSVSLGNAITPHWRLEVAVERSSNDVEIVDFNPETGQFAATGKVTATSLIGSAAYRFRPGRSVRPFVAAGLGATWLDYRVSTRGSLYLDDEATAPALQLAAGVDIPMSRHFDFVASVRSTYNDPVKLSRPNGDDYTTWHWVHSLNLGVRYSP